MRLSRVMVSCAVTTLGCWAFCAHADEKTDLGVNLFETKWISAGATIQELRERSTTTFEFLDENQSGSITLDEIDLFQMESDMSTMNPEELRRYSRRNSAIHNKFMSWSTEIDEFEVVDTNQDGVWNKDEYEVRHKNVQSHRLELGIQEWDADGNGAVELHEFNSHLDELELLDEDGDGKVSRKEAFKSEDSKVISDVLLNKLHLDEWVWKASPEAAPTGEALPPGATGIKIFRKVEVETSKDE